jgi:hypothetical protein
MSICIVNKTGSTQQLIAPGIMVGRNSIEIDEELCLYKLRDGRFVWELPGSDRTKASLNDFRQDTPLISQLTEATNVPSIAYSFPSLGNANDFMEKVGEYPGEPAGLNIYIAVQGQKNNGDAEDPKKDVKEIKKEGPSYP